MKDSLSSHKYPQIKNKMKKKYQNILAQFRFISPPNTVNSKFWNIRDYNKKRYELFHIFGQDNNFGHFPHDYHIISDAFAVKGGHHFDIKILPKRALGFALSFKI